MLALMIFRLRICRVSPFHTARFVANLRIGVVLIWTAGEFGKHFFDALNY